MGDVIRIQAHILRRNEEGERITAYIRKQIAEAREEKGFSQRELSKMLGRSSGFMQQIESGRLETITLDLIAIAKVLEKPIGYFYPRDIKKYDDPLKDEEWQLVRQFRRIRSVAARDVAIRQVRELAEMKPKKKK